MTTKYSNVEWNGKKVIIGETRIQTNVPIHVVIGFHGAGSTPENILVHGNQLKVNNSIMVYLEGPVDAGSGLWSWWRDGPTQAETVAAFLNYTSEMVDAGHRHIADIFPNNSIYTSFWGFSQGGAAALVWALLNSQSPHKIASVCGFLPETPRATPNLNSSLPILGIFGANDEIIPSFLAEYALDEMKNGGHNVTVKETPQGHELTSENLKDISVFFNS